MRLDITSFIFTPSELLVWEVGQFLHYVLHHKPTDERGSDEDIPLTDNLAERAIRPLVVIRKISGGSRTRKEAKVNMVNRVLYKQ